MSTAADLAARFADLAAGARNDMTNRCIDLAKRITDEPSTVSSSFLADHAGSLAFSEGAVTDMAAELTMVANYGVKVEADFVTVIAELNGAVLSMLTADPDDGWSGRGNDVRRSKNDGARRALENAARIIKAAQ